MSRYLPFSCHWTYYVHSAHNSRAEIATPHTPSPSLLGREGLLSLCALCPEFSLSWKRFVFSRRSAFTTISGLCDGAGAIAAAETVLLLDGDIQRNSGSDVLLSALDSFSATTLARWKQSSILAASDSLVVHMENTHVHLRKVLFAECLWKGASKQSRKEGASCEPAGTCANKHQRHTTTSRACAWRNWPL